jgi:hypothetical protein
MVGSEKASGGRGRSDARARSGAVWIGLGCVLVLAGCAGGTGGDPPGPAAITDGSYRLLATSAGQDPDATVSLTITGDTLVLTQGSDTTEDSLGQPGDTEYVLCPPGGTGSPRPLSAPIDVDGVHLARPALFGDCGQTTPVRVTLVDLDATTDQAFPFATWAEFCDTGDPDC